MNRKLVGITLALLTFSTAGAVHAVSPTESTAPTPESAADAPVPPPPASRLEPPPLLSPMHREIRDLVAREQVDVEALNIRFTRAVRIEEKLAIQREIEAVKLAGMIAVLDIQLRYAESGGHMEAAAQLRTSLEALRNPRIPVATVPTGR